MSIMAKTDETLNKTEFKAVAAAISDILDLAAKLGLKITSLEIDKQQFDTLGYLVVNGPYGAVYIAATPETR